MLWSTFSRKASTDNTCVSRTREETFERTDGFKKSESSIERVDCIAQHVFEKDEFIRFSVVRIILLKKIAKFRGKSTYGGIVRVEEDYIP